MRVGSLFAGVGGLDLGLERAGMEVVWQVEISPYRRAVLAEHWPNTKLYEDVKDVGRHNLSGVELICGGVPCQPFSTASRGRGKGTSDDRWLWPEMRRVVQELRPTWVLVEEVRGFDGPGLDQMVSDMEADQYEVGPVLEVPACAFGHDHWRPRLWICGYSNANREPGRTIDAEVAELPECRGEPRSVGKKNGVPTRMDRLRALGDAVVPQVAEWIGRQIVEANQHSTESE